MTRDLLRIVSVIAMPLMVAASGLPPIDAESISLDSLLNITITSAAKHEQTSEEAPASVTIITREDIHVFDWKTLSEALATACGIDVGTDLFDDYVGARGFTNAGDPYNPRILLLLNGIPLRESAFAQSWPNASMIGDIQGDVERIEILRGPGSSLYGTGAMLAIVNVITSSPDGPEETTASVSGGDHGFAASHARLRRTAGSLSFTLYGSAMRTDGHSFTFHEYGQAGYEDVEVRNLNWKRTYVARGQLKYKGLKAHLYVGSSQNGYPTAQYGTVFDHRDSKQRATNWGIDLITERSIQRNVLIYGRLGFQQFDYHAVFPYSEPDLLNFDSAVDRKVSAELRGSTKLHSTNQLIAGMELVRHVEAKNYGWYDQSPETYEFSEPFTDAGYFVHDEQRLPGNMVATVGLRYSMPTGDTGMLTPRGALVWGGTAGTTVKLMYGEAYRAPSVYERLYEFPEEAVANPELDPELARIAELTLLKRLTEGLYASLSGYRFQYEDMIITGIDEGSGYHQYQNLSNAYSHGIEAEVRLRSAGRVQAYASYAYQDARGGDDDERLPHSPYHVGKAGVSVPFASKLRAACDTRLESSRLTLLGTKTAPFWLHNVALIADDVLEGVALTLSVRNVFETSYTLPGSYDNLTPVTEVDMPAIQQPGRTTSLTISVTI
ncbi:MAG: TonB-dependent receptor [bacterium]|nr:TonB-dependent receptor [bacterium]